MIKAKVQFTWKAPEPKVIPILKQILSVIDVDSGLQVVAEDFVPEAESYEVILNPGVEYEARLIATNGLLDSEPEILKFKTTEAEQPNKPSGLGVNVTLTTDS